MSNKVPATTAKEIKERVFAEADKFHYLSKSRTENGRFLDTLVSNPDIGGKLSAYMKKAEVRTYIKDAILNRYSKDKTQAARPKDIRPIIHKKFGFNAQEIDTERDTHICVYKSIESTKPNQYVVVAEGTVLKWETALRKALLYMPNKPFVEDEQNTTYILLNIFAQYKPIPPADKAFLDKALRPFRASVHIYGEA